MMVHEFNDLFPKIYKIQKKINHKQIIHILDLLKFKKNFNIFHVTGTNGKGSVSTYLSQGFRKKYNKVGLLTSPHILKPNERIKINNCQISNKNLNKYIHMVLKINKNVPFPCLMYIVSLLYFCDNNVNIAVIEIGIGGRYDNTTAIKGEYGTVITIGIDHTEILGNTLEKIALDKAGVINYNSTFFLPLTLQENIQKIFRNEASFKNAKIVNLDINNDNYQLFNKKMALQILKSFNINYHLCNFKTPFGRGTIIQGKHNNNFILDVAHNLDGIQASIEYYRKIKTQYKKIVLSLSRDKDISSITKLLNNTDLYVYQNSSSRSFKLDQYPVGKHIHNLINFVDKEKR